MAISSVLGSSALLPAGLGFRNLIMNGDMRVDQRNTATTAVTVTTNAYTLDRWYVDDDSSAVVSVQQSTDVPAGQGFTNSLKATVTTAATSVGTTDYSSITQFIEASNSAQLAWGTADAKSVVVSFWVKATVTGTYSFTLYDSPYSRACPSAYTVNASNTWEKKTIYIAGDSSGSNWLSALALNGRGVGCDFTTIMGSSSLGTSGVWNNSTAYGVTGQVNAYATVGNIFAVTGVQLEANTQPTPFEQRPIGVELALCQRYCLSYVNLAMGYTRNGIDVYSPLCDYPTVMRTVPTLRSGATFTVSTGSAGVVTLASETTPNRAWFYNGSNNWSTGAIVKVTAILEAEL